MVFDRRCPAATSHRYSERASAHHTTILGTRLCSPHHHRKKRRASPDAHHPLRPIDHVLLNGVREPDVTPRSVLDDSTRRREGPHETDLGVEQLETPRLGRIATTAPSRRNPRRERYPTPKSNTLSHPFTALSAKSTRIRPITLLALLARVDGPPSVTARQPSSVPRAFIARWKCSSRT
jgi:hypothetical protein